MLIVDPKARALGVGTRLVEECIRFSRAAGYRSIVLWTNDILRAARKIYERAGFVMVSQEAHESFGQRLVGQTWKLELDTV
jgi:GNAT superfamily N-acetyltransferase